MKGRKTVSCCDDDNRDRRSISYMHSNRRHCHLGSLYPHQGRSDRYRSMSTTASREQVDQMRRLKEEMKLKSKGGNSVGDNDSVTDIDRSILDTEERYWEQLWEEGTTPWDLGRPTPVLIDELSKQPSQFIHNISTALIPGCGGGYDLVALAQFLQQEQDQHQLQQDMIFESNQSSKDKDSAVRTVIGLDISSTSIHRTKSLLEEVFDCENFPTVKVQLFQGDFFQDPSTWTLQYSSIEQGAVDNEIDRQSAQNKAMRLPSNQTFDFIFDYTFFSALPPNLRARWGQQMNVLLTKDNGKLFTLMFPHVKTPRADSVGPPYLVSYSDYEQSLQQHQHHQRQQRQRKSSEPSWQLTMITNIPYENPTTVEKRKGQECIGWWSWSLPDSRHTDPMTHSMNQNPNHSKL